MFKILLNYGRVVCVLLCCICSSVVVSAQNRITGKVTGADDKQPVIGASVKIKGTTLGTQTDVNGNFNLSAKPGDILEVSYIGYQNKEVPVGSQTHYVIVLSPASTSLNEVVVVGYGTQQKKDISGAVATVNVTDAKSIPASSSDQLLQGQAAGVTVITQGAPGASSNVFVRGLANAGNTTPLYVIDGVQTNSMSDLNPNDIESISVLKDAGSAAIYGVAGGNGVILITTKKGKAGKTTISYDAYYGTQVPPGGNVWHILSPQDMSKLSYVAGDASTYNKIYPGGSGTVPTYGWNGTLGSGAGSTVDLSTYHFDASSPSNDFLIQQFNQSGTDWFHAVFKQAPTQSHTITATGGSDKSHFLFSIGYIDQQGTLIDTYLKRYQARINSEFALTDNIRIGETANVFYRQTPYTGNYSYGYAGYNNQAENNAITESYRIMPQIPVYDVQGHYGGTFDGPGGEPLGNASNPVAIQQEAANNIDRTWNIQGTAYAEVDFLKHFTARTLIGGTVLNDWQYATGYNPYQDYEGHNNANSFFEQSQFISNYNWTNTLNYKQSFGKHNLNVLAGYEQRQYYGRILHGSSTNLFSVDPNYVNVGQGTSNNQANSYAYAPSAIQSIFGRLDYNFNDRYILSATIRRDGASNFGANRKWGNFPSISLAYRISQEDFMKNITWLNDLKIRGSYGELGSLANVGATNSFTTFSSGFGSSYYAITGSNNSTTQGFYNNQLGNINTGWETDKIGNIGFDATLFNRLDLSVEYYHKSISGLLFQIPLPATVGGASLPYVNAGDVMNRGWDVAATFRGASGDFRYSLGANITTYYNKFTNIPGSTPYFDVSGSRVGTLTRNAVGQPIGEFFGYKIIGIYGSNAQAQSGATYAGAAAGSFIYQDVNGDGKIDANDRTFIGNPSPKFTYGINLNASYKKWDFTAVLYGSQGNKDLNFTKYYTDFYSSFTGAKSTASLYNSWGSPGVNNPTVSAASYTQSMGSTIQSTYYVENGSFLKMRVAQIGYTFDSEGLKKHGIGKLHVYVQGTNLFTITKYDGLDPELPPSAYNGVSGSVQSAAFGIDYGNYPNNQRQYLLGVNVTF